MIVFGIDPGFASLGWAAIHFHNEQGKPRFRCDGAGVIRTKKTKEKIPIYQDNQDRAENIAHTLYDLTQEHGAVLIAVEAESWTRTASDKLIGIARGVIYGMARTGGYPLEQYPPQLVRKELIGKQAVSKTDLEDWLLSNVENLGMYLDRLPKGQRNHAADAAGVAITAIRRGGTIKLLQRLQSRGVG
jgi:Holliday junction resolvasome RuvABC endonuclease subunit